MKTLYLSLILEVDDAINLTTTTTADVKRISEAIKTLLTVPEIIPGVEKVHVQFEAIEEAI